MVKTLAVFAVGLFVLVGCADDDDALTVENGESTATVESSPPEETDPDQPTATEPTDESSAPSPEPNGGDDVDVTALISAEYSGIDEAVEVVARDQATWQDLWNNVTAGRDPPPQLPEVDFSREMVLFVALGQRPSGGHTVDIDRAVHQDGRMEVQMVERAPGADCAVTSAITSPVVAVAMPQSEDPVEFVHEVETYSCDS